MTVEQLSLIYDELIKQGKQPWSDKEFKEKDEALFQELVVRKNGHLFNTVRSGIYVEAGWYKIIGDFVDKAEEIVKQEQYKDLNLVIHQIKEKFGGLRIHFALMHKDQQVDEFEEVIINETHDVIKRAAFSEILSHADTFYKLASQTCEICGKPGTLRQNHWIRTLCDHHQAGVEKGGN